MTTSVKHRRGAREVLIEHRAMGATLEAAAHAAGMSPRTAYRREREAGYEAEIAARREEIGAEVGARLRAGAQRAASTLLELLDARYPPAIRLRAAESVLRHDLVYRKVEGDERRIEDVHQLALEQDRTYKNTRAFYEAQFGDPDRQSSWGAS